MGRRKGLKIPRGKPRTGSSPVFGTNIFFPVLRPGNMHPGGPAFLNSLSRHLVSYLSNRTCVGVVQRGNEARNPVFLRC